MASERLGVSASTTAPASGRLRETAPVSEWAKARERLAWLFVAPALLVVAIVAIYPLIKTFQLSFTNARLGLGKKTEWVGLDNYRYLYHDQKFFDSLNPQPRHFICRRMAPRSPISSSGSDASTR